MSFQGEYCHQTHTIRLQLTVGLSLHDIIYLWSSLRFGLPKVRIPTLGDTVGSGESGVSRE